MSNKKRVEQTTPHHESILNVSIRCYTQVIFIFTHKYKTRVEIDYNEKSTSLLQYGINYCDKMVQFTELNCKLKKKIVIVLTVALDDL